MNPPAMHLLLTTLAHLPPLELQGVSLLTHLRSTTGEWLPTPFTPDQQAHVRAATLEVVDYAQRCTQLTHQLRHLPPIPWQGVSPCT